MKSRNDRAKEAALRVFKLQAEAKRYAETPGDDYRMQQLASAAEEFTAWLDAVAKKPSETERK